MTVTDRELLTRAANEVIRQHGGDALLFAQEQIREMLHRCDIEGASAWQAVLRTIAEVERPAGSLFR